jgi:hypothetical protein
MYGNIWYNKARLQARLWTPTQVASSLTWWWAMPDSRFTVVSDDVSEVYNIRGSSDKLQQTTAGNRPDYINSAYGPYVNFDQARTTGLISPSASASAIDHLTILAVTELGSTTPNFGRLFSYSITTGADWNSAGRMTPISRNGTNNSIVGTHASANSAALAVPANTPSILGFWMRSQSYILTCNGARNAATSIGTSLLSSLYLSVGRMADGSTPWHGRMWEMLAFAGTSIDEPTLQRLEGYLAWRWRHLGVLSLLPFTHPYKQTPPTIGNSFSRLKLPRSYYFPASGGSNARRSLIII